MHTHDTASIYANELVKHGAGMPLWQPEPTSSGETEVGDIGFLQDGQFHRSFNVLKPPEHPANLGGVPMDALLERIIEVNPYHQPPKEPTYIEQSIECVVKSGATVSTTK